MEEKVENNVMCRKLVSQIEFYFSNANLDKDRFMNELIENEPEGIPVEVFLSFNKVKTYTSDIEILKKALLQSEKLFLCKGGTRVKSVVPYSPKKDAEDCTLYVEGIPQNADLHWLGSVFSTYGKIDYVSLPRYSNGNVKGFAFIEYSAAKDAEKVVEAFKAAGSYMPLDMPPGDLCSIKTFCKPDEHSLLNINENKSTENGIEKGTKRERGGDVMKAQIEEGQSCGKEKIPDKKLRLENSGFNAPKSENLANNIPDEINVSPLECGMKILSRYDWKKLRNSFLNARRKKILEVKKSFDQSVFEAGKKTKKNVVNSSSNCQENKAQAPARTYIRAERKLVETPGTVVKVEIGFPLVKVSAFKERCKQFYPDVVYVDVKEGWSHGYLRFLTPTAAIDFVVENDFPSSNILMDQDEKDYFDKIKADRAAMIQGRGKKTSGHPITNERYNIPNVNGSVSRSHIIFD